MLAVGVTGPYVICFPRRRNSRLAAERLAVSKQVYRSMLPNHLLLRTRHGVFGFAHKVLGLPESPCAGSQSAALSPIRRHVLEVRIVLVEPFLCLDFQLVEGWIVALFVCADDLHHVTAVFD